MLQIQQYKLNNGLSVIYCQTHHHPEFELSIHINTGARDETETVSGISHFLEHMMFRGSRHYPNSIMLARALEKFGGEINALTGIESTTYWMKGDCEKLLDAIPSFAEFFLFPNFADIEIERGVILQELASDYNDQGTCIDVEYLAMKTLFPNHPLGNPILGNYDSINRISLDDLNAKRAFYYAPSQCILSVYSSQNPDTVLKTIEKYFDVEWPYIEKNFNKTKTKIHYDRNAFNKNHPLKKSKNLLCFQNNSDNQFTFRLVAPISGGLSESSIHSVFLQRILDDGICTRLPGNIREQHGLVYDISCDTQFFYDVGVLGIDVTVSDDRFGALLQKLAYEMKLLLNSPPSKEEVEHIRSRYLFDLKQVMMNPSRFLHRQTNAIFMNSNFSLEEEVNVVKSIDQNIIHQTALNTFVQNFRGFALVGPKAKKQRKSVENFLKIFEH